LENDEGTLLELQAWWEQQKRLENKLAINGVRIIKFPKKIKKNFHF
jgi:hypothetical protein